MNGFFRWWLAAMRVSFAGGGGGGNDDARRMEEERQEKIRQGTNRVNEIFGGPMEVPDKNQPAAPVGRYGQLMSSVTPVLRTRTIQAPGQFGDDYFSSIRQAYLDYYLPQVDEQFENAVRAIKLRTPSLGSSSYARRSGELTRDYERAKADVSDRAESSVGEARSNIENSRNQILAAVRSGAGAADAANSATEAVRALKAPPVYSPIGDIFARFLTTGANATLADNAGYRQTPLSLNTLFKPRKAAYTVE